ncbi:hypothetical protein BH10PSE2_BH10PSE2_21800 [soil metagenome]
MNRMVLLTVACLSLIGCGPTLPNGYSVTYGDRGKAWLASPDGTIAHGALIKRLYRTDDQLLLITYPERLGGEIEGPRPLDGTCYIALLIDTNRQQVRQIRTVEADRLSPTMNLVESSDADCSPEMPVS